MPIAINVNTGRNESPLDKVMKGLALAKGVLEVGNDVGSLFKDKKIDYDTALKKQQLEDAQRKGRQEYTPAEYAQLKLGTSPLSEGVKNERLVAAGIGEGPLAPAGLSQGPRIGKLVTPSGVEEVEITDLEAKKDQRDYELRKGHNDAQLALAAAQFAATRQEKESARQDKKDERKAKPQEALDVEYAKDFAKRIAGGGYADADKGLKQLDGAIKALKKTGSATGPIVGLIPKVGRDIVTPSGAAIQDAVEEVVQRNLRQVLGAQFTEKEGDRLIARAYNPRLSEGENVKRLNRLKLQIGQAIALQKDADAYFQENGSLKGFKGKTFNSADDFNLDDKAADGGWNDADEKRLRELEALEAKAKGR